MKTLLLILGMTFAGVVYANCVTNTTFYNGKMVTCTTCCYNGNCTTNCF